ncbi:MAG: DUF1659 domain-containing protein [Firmicutes bacterium]|nr:DUF1659 domain-containing protein [Bacillota bacterium]
MAVEKNAVGTRLQLRVSIGSDGEGREILRTRTYSNVKTDAEDQGLYDVAMGLVDLQENEVKEIHRIDDVILMEV